MEEYLLFNEAFEKALSKDKSEKPTKVASKLQIEIVPATAVRTCFTGQSIPTQNY